MNEASRQRRLTNQIGARADLGTGFRSVRRNTIPVSTGAGDSVSNTFTCVFDTVALIEFRNVRCRIIPSPFLEGIKFGECSTFLASPLSREPNRLGDAKTRDIEISFLAVFLTATADHRVTAVSGGRSYPS